MDIDRIDHVVLTVSDIERTCAFYARVLGMEPIAFAGGRKALAFGNQKFNLHQWLTARNPAPHGVDGAGAAA
jgi:catechol 2,3-dioxygenase-like lactoylglutathione lyase family enzyme